MKMIAFDVRGSVAHFRRPDTTATQMSYPFIPPTVAKGLVGAILGIEDFKTNDRVGIRLLAPVFSVAQQMSMLGNSGSSFNRPTSIELLVNPAYRIYYAGEEHVEDLLGLLRAERSVYPTYLGSAYALTKPILHQVYDRVELLKHESLQETISTQTVVPIDMVEDIVFRNDREYSRAGGFMRHYLGERTFEKSVDYLYERQGRDVEFLPKVQNSSDAIIVRAGEETICLV